MAEIDESQEAVITIDDKRSVTVVPTTDGQNLVMTVEDPQSVAVVEMERGDVVALYEALEDWIKR
jgi:hypothetical protein